MGEGRATGKTYTKADDIGGLPGRRPDLTTYLQHGEFARRNDDIRRKRRKIVEKEKVGGQRAMLFLNPPSVRRRVGEKRVSTIKNALVSSRNVRTRFCKFKARLFPAPSCVDEGWIASGEVAI